VNRRSLIILATLALALAATSCAIRPDDVLPNRTMVRVLVDLHRTEGILQTAGYNYGHEADVMQYYQVVLERNGVTQAEFDSSLVWYTDHPAYFTRVYPKVRKELQRLYDEEQAKSVDNSAMRAKIAQDSIYLQQEPPVDSIASHKRWELLRYHVKELYKEPEPLELCTQPILDEMARKRREEEQRKSEMAEN